jgi:lipoyl synthase
MRTVMFAAPGSRRYENEYFTNSPHSFVNVSITGTECTRGCAHCQGRLLERMTPAPTPERLRTVADTLVDRGCKGVLISGGADGSGEVALLPYVEALSYARERGLRVVVQPGLIDLETAKGLKDAGVEQVLLDVVADYETIRDVLHMDRAPEDFLGSMLACRSVGLKFAPHVVIGLHFGSIRGESRALRFIREAEPQALVLVVLQPLRDTPMAGVRPPSVEQVRSIMAAARESHPDTPLALGCAQPRGIAKRRIEQIAIDTGFDAIAYPEVSTIAYTESRGLSWEFSELCCSLAVGSASAQVLS